MPVTRLSLLGVPWSAPVAAPAPVWVLGIDVNTLLMIHADGDEGSQTFIDEADDKGITAFADVAVSHDEVKFGNGAAKFLGDYGDDSTALRVAADADWNFGTGGLTVDFWAWSRSLSNRPWFGGWYSSDSDRLDIGKHSEFGTGLIRYRARLVLAGVTVFDFATDPIDVQDGWAHFAIVRDGANVYLFIDGTLAGSATIAAGQAIDLSGLPLYVGRVGLDSLDGYIDEFRVSNVARWTAAFVPQAWPYSGVRTGAARGRSNVLAARTGSARGTFDLVLSARTGAARGRCDVLNSRTGSARGRHNTDGAHTGAARGSHDCILHALTGSARGRHGVMNEHTGAARGSHAILVEHTGSARGTFTLRAGHTGSARGKHGILIAHTGAARGTHSMADGLGEYQLFRGIGAEPDLTAAPWQTFTGLPYDMPALAFPATYYFVLRRRNTYGLVSPNVSRWRVILDAAGLSVDDAPHAPEYVKAGSEGAGARIKANYAQTFDPESARADKWVVWITAGSLVTDPERGVTPIAHEEAMVFVDGVAKLNYVDTSIALTDGWQVKVDVAAARSGTPDVYSAADIVSFIYAATGPVAPPTPGFTTPSGNTLTSFGG